ncbi:hypothetical protein Gotri_001993, partial [Gossypium trilobum]|nr:hypothetical protein [Gossypium trilobum]
MDEDRSCICSLIKEIKERGCRFRRLSFKHISREANKVAHVMAKYGERYKHPRFWIEEAPHAIELLVNQERRSNSHYGLIGSRASSSNLPPFFSPNQDSPRVRSITRAMDSPRALTDSILTFQTST